LTIPRFLWWPEDLSHLIGRIDQAVVASGASNGVLKCVLCLERFNARSASVDPGMSYLINGETNRVAIAGKKASRRETGFGGR
jgi:hypothetical protein